MESRRLYNEMLKDVKNYYEQTGSFLFKYSLMTRFKGRSGEYVPATTVQTLADRLDKALRRYLSRRELHRRAGFPRFKSANRWHSIRLRQYGKGRDVWLEGGRLRVPGKLGKSIKMKQHRPLEGTPKTAHLVLRADGKWYVLVISDLGDLSHARGDKPDVGIDVGLKVFLADSEGSMVENPRYYRKSQKKLRRSQRKLCRCKKGSFRRQRAARSAANTHLKISRQRKDFLHKTAKRYVDNYGRIFVEDLNVSGMVRNHHLAKSIVDASWAKFVEILESKAEEAGSQVIKVPARYTTQACSNCGKLVTKSLSARRHCCGSCGYVEDRDINAAKNVLWAGMQPSERNVAGSGVRAPRSRQL